MKKKPLIGMIAAGGLAATALAVTAASAQAGQILPTCRYHAHACVAVLDATGLAVHSIRVNGQCLWFSSAGQDPDPVYYFPKVAVNYNGTPTTLTYSGYHCERWSQNSEDVEWGQTTGAGNYRWAKLSVPSDGSGHVIG